MARERSVNFSKVLNPIQLLYFKEESDDEDDRPKRRRMAERAAQGDMEEEEVCRGIVRRETEKGENWIVLGSLLGIKASIHICSCVSTLGSLYFGL